LLDCPIHIYNALFTKSQKREKDKLFANFRTSMKKAVELLDLYEITVPDNGDKEKQFFKFFLSLIHI